MVIVDKKLQNESQKRIFDYLCYKCEIICKNYIDI